jgi:hypothetical protein
MGRRSACENGERVKPIPGVALCDRADRAQQLEDRSFLRESENRSGRLRSRQARATAFLIARKPSPRGQQNSDAQIELRQREMSWPVKTWNGALLATAPSRARKTKTGTGALLRRQNRDSRARESKNEHGADLTNTDENCSEGKTGRSPWLANRRTNT